MRNSILKKITPITLFIFINLSNNGSCQNQAEKYLDEGLGFLKTETNQDSLSYARNRFINAIESFSVKHSRLKEAYAGLAQAYFFLGEINNAEKACREALSMKRKFGWPYRILGLITLTRKDTLKAEKNFKQAVKYAPGDAKTKYELGKIYLNRNNYDTALFYLKDITVKDAEFRYQQAAELKIHTLYQLCKQHLSGGKTRQAMGVFQKLVVLLQKHPVKTSKINAKIDELIQDLTSLLHAKPKKNEFRQILKNFIKFRNQEEKIVDLYFDCLLAVDAEKRKDSERIFKKLSTYSSRYFEKHIRTLQNRIVKLPLIDSREWWRKIENLARQHQLKQAIKEYARLVNYDPAYLKRDLPVPTDTRVDDVFLLCEFYLDYLDSLPLRKYYLAKLGFIAQDRKISEQTQQAKFLSGVSAARTAASRDKALDYFSELLQENYKFKGRYLKDNKDKWAHYLFAKAIKLQAEKIKDPLIKKKFCLRGAEHCRFAIQIDSLFKEADCLLDQLEGVDQYWKIYLEGIKLARAGEMRAAIRYFEKAQQLGFVEEQKLHSNIENAIEELVTRPARNQRIIAGVSLICIILFLIMGYKTFSPKIRDRVVWLYCSNTEKFLNINSIIGQSLVDQNNQQNNKVIVQDRKQSIMLKNLRSLRKQNFKKHLKATKNARKKNLYIAGFCQYMEKKLSTPRIKIDIIHLKEKSQILVNPEILHENFLALLALSKIMVPVPANEKIINIDGLGPRLKFIIKNFYTKTPVWIIKNYALKYLKAKALLSVYGAKFQFKKGDLIIDLPQIK